MTNGNRVVRANYLRSIQRTLDSTIGFNDPSLDSLFTPVVQELLRRRGILMSSPYSKDRIIDCSIFEPTVAVVQGTTPVPLTAASL